MISLEYPFKAARTQIEQSSYVHAFAKEGTTNHINIHGKLFFGDNMDVLYFLRDFLRLKNKIDFIYIDPPYATKQAFTLTDTRGSTISRSAHGIPAYDDTLTGSEYLEFLRRRIILLYSLLSDKGSFFLHIDYKIGHYVKLIMDEVFGQAGFRNDISRIKCNPKNFNRKAFGNIKDMILFYVKSEKNIWNDARDSYSESQITSLFPKVDPEGRRYTTVPLHAPGITKHGQTGCMWRGMLPPEGRHWRYAPSKLDVLDTEGAIEWSATGNPRIKVYADAAFEKGRKMQDIIEFKDPPYPNYPTEKNQSLLERLILATTNPDSIVLDAFAGSGTTLAAAVKLNREFIGIDSSPSAIKTIQSRLGAERFELWKPTEAGAAPSNGNHTFASYE